MSANDRLFARILAEMRARAESRQRSRLLAQNGNFRRLERRRVLSVNAAFNAVSGILNIDITSGGTTQANLLVDGTDFYVDANNNLTLDGAETSGALVDLRQVLVNSVDNLGGFFWGDNFATAPMNAAGSVVRISNIDDVHFDTSLTANGNVELDVNNSVRFDGSLTINGTLEVTVASVAGQVFNDPGAALAVTGQSTIDAASVVLGDQAGDSILFSSLAVNSTGAVDLELDSGVTLLGSSSGTAFSLIADGTIDVQGSVTGGSGLLLAADGLDSDLLVNAAISTGSGNIDLSAGDSVVFAATGSATTAGAFNIAVFANSDGLDGNGADELRMVDGSSIDAGAGTIVLSTSGASGGDVSLAFLTTTSASTSAVQILSQADIVDSTAAETANILAASGTVQLMAANGAIGAGVAAAGIDLDAARLQFVASNALAGVVQITDLAGGIVVSAASVAGGGGSLTANSPLVISASIAVGASMVFTAGDSALAGDNLTIDSGAVVTLTSAAAATLTFNAGDDIVFDTGSVVTTGGGVHTVILAADLDNAGVGAADGDRGGITQDGTALVEVETDLLIADAATGIDLDTTVVTLDALNVLSGDILIDETNGLTLTDVTNLAGSIDISASGLVTAVNVVAGGTGSSVTLATTTGGITATTVTAASSAVLSALSGDIATGTVVATAGSVDIDATAGDVLVGSVSAGTTVSIDTPAGSINDAQDDALTDVTAGGTIALSARDEIAGIAADGRLELAAGSVLTASSTSGDIVLRGLGALTLTSLTTGDGAIDVIAAGTIHAVSLDTTGTDSAANGVTLVATGATSDIVVQRIVAGPAFGDVTLTADRNITDGDSPVDNLDISANDISLTAVTGSIGGTSLDVFKGVFDPLEVVATGSLTATAAAGAVALDATVAGTVTITALAAVIQSTGDLDVSGSAFAVTHLAVIADSDGDGAGVLTVGPVLSVTGDLRVSGADVVATDGSIDLVADRLLFFSRAAESIGVTVNTLDATSLGSLTVVSLSAAVDLLDLNCDNVALQSLGSAGSVSLTSSGTVTVSDDVLAGNDGLTTSTGSVTIIASGAASSIIVNDVILTDAGDITLLADNDVRFGGPLSPGDAADTDDLTVVTTGTGNIRIEADADLTNSGAGGLILMADGSRVIAGRDLTLDWVPGINGLPSPSTIVLGAAALIAGQAQISLSADGSVTVGSLQSANATADAIRVTSRNGGIVDGGDAGGEADLWADHTGALITLRAVHGIGSANALETSGYALDASNRDGLLAAASGNVRILELASGGSLNVVHGGNQADSGSLIVDVAGGDLRVAPASFTPSNGDSQVTTEMGNLRLSASGDLILDELVTSGSGNLTLLAGDDVLINASVSTGGAGTVLLEAGNAAADGTSGVVMASATSITTLGGNVRIAADNEGDIRLGLVDAGAGSISLLAERSILDNNGALANLRGSTARIIADASLTNASNLVGRIGDGDPLNGLPATNLNAIDLEVGTVAARSADGIYLIDADSLTVGSSGDISVVRVASDTTLSAVTDTALSDMATTDDGSVKLVAAAGTLTVTDGADGDGIGVSAGGAGDILLEARGAASDVVISAGASLIGVTGHISLVAGDDIDLNATLTTGGPGTVYLLASNGTLDAVGPEVDGINVDAAVTSGTGDILLDSARDLRLTAAVSSTSGDIGLVAARAVHQIATVDAGTGDVLISAGTGSITLGLVEGDTVAVSAGGDILDGNLAATNVRATELSLRAGGTIGMPDLISPAGTNNNAIDTEVVRIAASSATGIYLREVLAGGSLDVDRVSAVTVAPVRVNFNSTTSPPVLPGPSATIGALDDLTTTGGPIKVVTEGGTLTIHDGLDGDGAGVSAGGAGNILLEARGAGNDLVVNAGTASGTGSLTLRALDDIDLNATVATAGSGTIWIVAGDAVSISGAVLSADGNILVHATGSLDLSSDIASLTGDIGLSAGGTLTQAGDITGGRDILVFATGSMTMDAFSEIDAARNVHVVSGGSLTLGYVSGDNVAIEVSGGITDGNGPGAGMGVGTGPDPLRLGLNVRATSLGIIGGLGSVGGSDLASGSAAINRFAIDIDVGTVAASGLTGIWLHQIAGAGTLTVGTVVDTLIVVRADDVHFRSTVSEAAGISFLSENISDLTAAVGPVKVVVSSGSLVLNDGNLNGISVIGGGGAAGGVLLEARGAGSDVIVNADVRSSSGHIAIIAGDDIRLNDAGANPVIETGLSGSVLLRAANGTLDSVGPEVDGITVSGEIETAAGDILLESGGQILVLDPLTSATGDIGLFAAGDITLGTSLIAAPVTTGGSVVFGAGGGIAMDPGSTIVAGGNLLLDAAGDLLLGSLTAVRVSLNAGGDMLDNNGAALNVSATDLRISAGGTIGAPDLLNLAGSNDNAIDTAVSTVAAFGAGGVYLRETAGGLRIDNVADLTVTVDVTGLEFRSTSSAVSRATTLATLDDVTSTAGPVKIVVESGSLTIADGLDGDGAGVRAGGTGAILLEARGAASDLIQLSGAQIDSGSGNLSLLAGDDIVLGDVLATGAAGTIDVLAGNGTADAVAGISMGVASSLTTAGGDIRMVADSEGDILLGLVDAGAGRVSLIAEGSILDANGAALNVRASSLRASADAIVNPDGSQLLAGSLPAVGNQTGTVGTVADAIETSVDSLAVRSADGIYIRESDAVSVESSGSVTIVRNHFNSTSSVVSDGELSDLRTTDSGAISLVTTDGAISVNDGANSDGFGVESAGTGDVTLVAGGADRNLILNTHVFAGGDVNLAASGAIDEGSASARISGDLLTLVAGRHAHLHHTTVHTLMATVGSTGLLDGIWQTVNTNASLRGDDFVNQLGSNLTGATLNGSTTDGESLADVRANYRFAERYAGEYALYLKNSQTLEVASITAGASDQPNIYVETIGAVSDLNVTGAVLTSSTTADEGGIVMIAGQRMTLSASLTTVTTLQSQVANNIHRNPAMPSNYLGAFFFDGGEGIVPDPALRFTTTQHVIKVLGSVVAEDFRTHVQQRVAIQFGNPAETGFFAWVGYADGLVQFFNVRGEQGIPADLNGADLAPVPAFPQSPLTTGIFTRSTPFGDAFLDANQMLPTIAILRRADDFFLFENGSAATPEGIADLNVEFEAIDNVTSLGAGWGVPIPPNIPSVTIASAMTLPAAPPLATPVFLPAAEIEFGTQQEKRVEVGIYRVNYDDLNFDGQVDANELPSFDRVRLAVEAGIRDAEAGAADPSAGESGDSTVRFEENIENAEGGSPTPEDIDREKNRLMDDPQQPSGAYAIVQRGINGEITVIDVFAIRDWEESSRRAEPQTEQNPAGGNPKSGSGDNSQGNSPTPPEGRGGPTPAPQNPDGSRGPSPNSGDVDETPEGSQTPIPTRSAALGFLAASLGSTWASRMRGVSAANADLPASSTTPAGAFPPGPGGFSRATRRKRRVQRAVFRVASQSERSD